MRFTVKRIAAILVLVGVLVGCRRVRQFEMYCNPGATRPEEGMCFDGERCCVNVCISSALSCVDDGAVDAGADGGASDAGADGGASGGDAGGASLLDAAVFTISPDNGYDAIGASVGVDLAGRATVVWAQAVDPSAGTMIQTRRYSPDAGWTDAGVISLVQAGSPQLAVSATGAGVVAWFQEGTSRVYAARFGADGGFSAVSGVESNVPFGAGPSTNMSVAADRSGNVVCVVWERDNRVYWNVSLDGGDWATSSEVSDDVLDASAVSPFAAFHPTSGEVFVAFVRAVQGYRRVLVRRTNVSGSGWESAYRIDSEANSDANAPRLGADDFGNVIAVWDQAPPGGATKIWSNRFTPDAGGWWGDAGLVSDGDDRNSSAELAVDGDGGAVVVWLMDAGVIRWSRFSPVLGPSWSEPLGLSTPTASGSWAQVAIARNGTGGVVWIETVANDFSVRLAPLAGLNMGTTSQVAFGTGGAMPPAIAINPSGIGSVVVWSANGDAGIKRVYAVQP